MAVPNSARSILVAGLALSLAVLTGCGATANQTATDTSSSSDPAQKQTTSVAVTVTPAAVTLAVSQTQSFSAAVTGSTNSSVTWFVNGVSAGNPTLGSITSSGLYTAPTVAPGTPVSISAVSAADPTKSASAVVSFSAPPPPPPSGTNYYVSPAGNDGNDGSQQHPWLTIQQAAAVAQAGATVHVAAGNYSGAITTQINGTASARIRFISDVQWGAVIRAASVDIIWTNLADYVDIEGFDIAGTTADTCSGIINYASYVHIVGNHVHNVGLDSAACMYGAGIVNHMNGAGHDDDIIANVVHDIGDYNHANQLQHGIYHANLRGHIWNNLVYRCQGWGIHLWHAATQVTIANNTLFNNAYGGMLIGDGDDPGGFPAGVINDYTIVSNNIVYGNGLQPGASGFGIEEYGNTGPHNQYLNNLVYQNGPSDWRLQNGITPVATVSAEPQFVNYQPDGSGDYHLQSASPALHVGTNVGAPGVDLTGAPRPSALPDLGTYQSNSTPGTWPFSQ